ncbi:MAG TPA: hypothetical protein VGK70_13645 [Thermoanaerobaculia bacterium]
MAVKVLPAEFSADADRLRWFEREAQEAIEGSALSSRRATDYAIQMAQGLAAAHEK